MKTTKSATVGWVMGSPDSTGWITRTTAAEIARKHRKDKIPTKRTTMGIEMPTKSLHLLTRNLKP